jgi:hypothetical protein
VCGDADIDRFRRIFLGTASEDPAFWIRAKVPGPGSQNLFNRFGKIVAHVDPTVAKNYYLQALNRTRREPVD